MQLNDTNTNKTEHDFLIPSKYFPWNIQNTICFQNASCPLLLYWQSATTVCSMCRPNMTRLTSISQHKHQWNRPTVQWCVVAFVGVLYARFPFCEDDGQYIRIVKKCRRYSVKSIRGTRIPFSILLIVSRFLEFKNLNASFVWRHICCHYALWLNVYIYVEQSGYI